MEQSTQPNVDENTDPKILLQRIHALQHELQQEKLKNEALTHEVKYLKQHEQYIVRC
jgi:hypothetical protein